jgi:hypothetical protein
MGRFEAPDRDTITAFHMAALADGSPDDGAPGTRDWAPNAYAVYCFKEA